ncbi:hypothetical protein ACL02T_20375 [Pseudonocardia sp. RS010]|uniref:hypothetical protein n=1 Tax=Pseudonocardia sp. RS010 TaxID=3385979 RepID=UPI0039A05EE7
MKLTFAGDSKDLEKTFDKVGKGADSMSRDVDKSMDRLRKSGDKMDGFADKAGEVDTKAMGFRDTITGLQDSFKGLTDDSLPLGDRLFTLGMGVGDLASGFENFLIPQAKGAYGWLKNKLPGSAGASKKALGEIGDAAEDAALALGEGGGKRKRKGLKGAIKGLGAVAGIAGLGAVTIGLDEVSQKAGVADDDILGMQDSLHSLSELAKRVFTGDFEGIAKKAREEWNNAFNSINFSFELGPARQQVSDLISDVNGESGTVNIYGRTEPAGQALSEVIQAIKDGRESVTIDGQPIPAQDALNRIVAQIDEAYGVVNINGNSIPAGQALRDMLYQVNAARGVFDIAADTSEAQWQVNQFIRMNDGRKIRIFTTSLGSGGIASAGRLASGGPVVGPGTGTSDTAGLFALSNGEYVLTARDVARLGGFQGVDHMLSSIRGMADGGPVGRAPMVGAGRSLEIQFSGNVDSAFATAFMKLVRTGQIQIRS